MTDLDWLERIGAADVAATARTRTVVDTGAFKLLLDPHDDSLGMNWAAPLAQRPGAAEIDALCGAFRARGRAPRLEFVAECWPDVAAVLESAGFRAEGPPQDIMLVTRETFLPFAAGGVAVRQLEPDDDDSLFAAYLETQARGFGYDGEVPTPERVASWRGQVRGGRRAALALLEARAVGVGTALGAQLAELQGVTTLAGARRRGVAASLSSALVADLLGGGAEAVWLSVEEQAARACYAKIGFRAIGSRLNYSLA